MPIVVRRDSVGSPAFEVDFQGDTVVIYRWTNDRSEKLEAASVKFLRDLKVIELRLGTFTLRLGITVAKQFFGAAAELVDRVFLELIRPKRG